MSNQIFRPDCRRVEVTGNWEVFCLRCANSIGTMSSEILRAAVWRLRDRGGILCVECRQCSCAECGIQIYNMGDEKPGPDKPKVCLLCDLDIEFGDEITFSAIDERAVWAVAPSCLVPHISKKQSRPWRFHGTFEQMEDGRVIANGEWDES